MVWVIILINYNLIGQRIKHSRLKKKITQEKLAERLNISTEYCSKIECGKVKVNLQRLAQISLILDEKIEYLISGTVVGTREYLKEDIASVINSLSSDKINALFEIAKVISKLK